MRLYLMVNKSERRVLSTPSGVVTAILAFKHIGSWTLADAEILQIKKGHCNRFIRETGGCYT